MSNDSAQGRAVGAHPGSFSGGENFRWTSWAQTDSDPLCARSGTVDSQHRRAMAHAAAELPELQNCASAFSELVMIVSSHGLFKLTGYLALKRVYMRLFNAGKDSTSVSFPLQPLRPHNARTRARARPRPKLTSDLGHALVRGLVRAFARGLADLLVDDLVGCLGPRDCAATRRGWVGWNSARRSRRNSRDGGGGRRRSRPCISPAPPQAAMALSTWVAAPLILASIR